MLSRAAEGVHLRLCGEDFRARDVKERRGVVVDLTLGQMQALALVVGVVVGWAIVMAA